MYFNTSLASIRDFYFGLECGTTGDQQTDINAESEQVFKDHAWRSPLIFHICFISSSDTFHCALKISSLLTLTNSLFLSLSTCHSSSSSLLPYLSPPPFLPVPPHYFSSVLSVSPLHLPSKTFSGSRGGFSLCAYAEIHRCSIYGACVSTDRRWVNAIKRWWKQNRQKNIRESAW